MPIVTGVLVGTDAYELGQSRTGKLRKQYGLAPAVIPWASSMLWKSTYSRGGGLLPSVEERFVELRFGS